MSALRQIGIANVAYSSENNGSISVLRDVGEWRPWEGNGMKYATNSFIGRMAPYLFPHLAEWTQRFTQRQSVSRSLSETHLCTATSR
jgi:hypothetical protein